MAIGGDEEIAKENGIGNISVIWRIERKMAQAGIVSGEKAMAYGGHSELNG
jgi:hypothetical protein